MSIDPALHLRQLTLAEIGEAGQQALGRATCHVPAEGLGGDVATLYAERAGFAAVSRAPASPGSHPVPAEAELTQAAPIAVLTASRAVLRAMRDAIGLVSAPLIAKPPEAPSDP